MWPFSSNRRIARYHGEHGSWTMYFEPLALPGEPPAWLRRWRGDGILTRVGTPSLAKALQATRLPVIDLRRTLRDSGFFTILADNTQVARLALEHLNARGFRNLAFCGLPPGRHHNLDQRRDEFRRLVEEAGLAYSAFLQWKTAANWEREQDLLAHWLRHLPKPVGILACSDDCGYQLLDACRRVGLAVPEEVAVIGVDNDLVLCGMSNPPLTSIDLDGERQGYEAAVWLDRLMRGEKPPAPVLRIEPRGLVGRRSTDFFAFDDPHLAAALRFIHDHACEGVRVSDILRVAPLSQCELERRFQRYLGRTPKAELLRVQIEHARRLLHETPLPLESIARRCGFSTEQYFSDAFLRQCGVRPSVYRKERAVISHR